MTDHAVDFVRDGMVVVEDALDRDFCEAVVTQRLAEAGVDESDPATWPTTRFHMHAATVYKLANVAPAAARVLDELVGGPDAIAFGDLSDNLIVNFPDRAEPWWPPQRWDAPTAQWHKDGDWFRHFLDSPEQGILGIVFWRDVTERQGATYVAADSLAPVARRLADHPEGIDPPVPVDDIVAQCRDFRALTGRQGTIVWAHPFLVHTASVNATDELRIISNMTAMLRTPPSFSGPGPRTPIEQTVLSALGANELHFRITGERARIESERERRWKAAQRSSGADATSVRPRRSARR